eukprot:TRINITY_DN86566_c1_g1_i1.p1 TRINITY_DN86566_c1_g1~~TRINITY_DN86566_c1_g1_i1.p1  ORF type:complete len:150 (+),score=27.80 TRINITY_DN86566_c1_g1_i1:90-539(+)
MDPFDRDLLDIHHRMEAHGSRADGTERRHGIGPGMLNQWVRHRRGRRAGYRERDLVAWDINRKQNLVLGSKATNSRDRRRDRRIIECLHTGEALTPAEGRRSQACIRQMQGAKSNTCKDLCRQMGRLTIADGRPGRNMMVRNRPRYRQR